MSHKNRIKLVCCICRKQFEVAASRAKRRKTCGPKCKREHYRKKMKGNTRAAGSGPNSGSFTSGLTPWNKNKSVRLSPKSEFKQGHKPATYAPVGSVTIRTDKAKKKRAWMKIAEPNKWKPRAVVVWEKRFGKVPRGCVVHHCDRNTLNDHIDNLACLTRRAHILEHRNG